MRYGVPGIFSKYWNCLQARITKFYFIIHTIVGILGKQVKKDTKNIIGRMSSFKNTRTERRECWLMWRRSLYLGIPTSIVVTKLWKSFTTLRHSAVGNNCWYWKLYKNRCFSCDAVFSWSWRNRFKYSKMKCNFLSVVCIFLFLVIYGRFTIFITTNLVIKWVFLKPIIRSKV